MTGIAQEIMTAKEAAAWFRRSTSWLRQQEELLRIGGSQSAPLFHIRVCRAFMLAKMCGISGPELRQAQIAALAEDCGLNPAALAQAGINETPQLDEVDDVTASGPAARPDGDRNQA